jgi:hypothetical protein
VTSRFGPTVDWHGDPIPLHEVTIMFQFINDLFKQTARPGRRQHRGTKLKFESLETRQVLAANVWAAIGPPPQAPTEQISIIFPALHKVEFTNPEKISPEIKPVGGISPELKRVGHINPELKPVGGISPEFKPVGHISPSFHHVGYINWSIKPLGNLRPDIPVGMITPAGHENPPW